MKNGTMHVSVSGPRIPIFALSAFSLVCRAGFQGKPARCAQRGDANVHGLLLCSLAVAMMFHMGSSCTTRVSMSPMSFCSSGGTSRRPTEVSKTMVWVWRVRVVFRCVLCLSPHHRSLSRVVEEQLQMRGFDCADKKKRCALWSSVQFNQTFAVLLGHHPLTFLLLGRRHAGHRLDKPAVRVVFQLPKWTDRCSRVSFSSVGSWPAIAGAFRVARLWAQSVCASGHHFYDVRLVLSCGSYVLCTCQRAAKTRPRSALTGSMLLTTLREMSRVTWQSVIGRPQNTSSWTGSEAECRDAQRQTIVFRLASVEELLEGLVVLRQDGHAHTEHQSKLPWCESSEEGLLSFVLLASEWTQNAKDVIDPMLFMSNS